MVALAHTRYLSRPFQGEVTDTASYRRGRLGSSLMSSPWSSRKLFSSRLGLLFSSLAKYLDGENLAKS